MGWDNKHTEIVTSPSRIEAAANHVYVALDDFRRDWLTGELQMHGTSSDNKFSDFHIEFSKYR